MAFHVTTPGAGWQPIATNSTVKNHPLGTIVSGTDPTLGGGEFIYLQGVANTAVGSLVTYNASGALTALCPDTASLAQPVAVAMSACVDNEYGWYQIAGTATIKKTAVIFGVRAKIWLSGTPGSVAAASVAGKELTNARTANAASVLSATGTITATINRPHAQGAAT
jgi:hypothetical protein